MFPKECLTCAFNENPPEDLGGLVFETKYFKINHCFGPVSEGSMVLAFKHHVEYLDQLDKDQAEEYGKISVALAGAIRKATGADRVYISMWAEGSRHVHLVFMPVTAELRQRFGGLKASRLQAAMKEANYSPDSLLARQYSARIAEILSDQQARR